MGETTKRIRAACGQATPIAVDGPKLTALSDGYLDLDLSRFPNVARGIGDDLALADGQDLNDLTVSVNCFLIETDGRVCLVDAGDSNRRGPFLGHLRAALKQAGYAPEDVTDVLMTHLHGDHAAGLFEDGKLLCPNANLHVAREEEAFWRDRSRQDEIQATVQPIAEAALDAYRDRLVRIEPGETVAPGVVAKALPGHTPGQVGFQMGEHDPVLICADALHLPALQVRFPEWGFLFDADGPKAHETRVALMREVAKSGVRLAGAHIPYPGVIRLFEGETGLGFERADG